MAFPQLRQYVMTHEPLTHNSPLPSLHSTTSSSVKSAKKAIKTLKCATTKGTSVMSYPFKKARSSTCVLSNNTEDAGMSLLLLQLKFTQALFQGIAKAPNVLSSTLMGVMLTLMGVMMVLMPIHARKQQKRNSVSQLTPMGTSLLMNSVQIVLG
jgi:ATP-dependent Zn protease